MDTNSISILGGVMGSTSYGTNTSESDIDSMEILVPSIEYYLGLKHWGQSGTVESKGEQNGKLVEYTGYELKKFVNLCAKFNPNVIPMLWLDSYTMMSPGGRWLIDNRSMFSSQNVYHTFIGYAHAQYKRMMDPDCPTGTMGAKRKELREKYGFDTKFAFHTVRLLRMAIEFLANDGEKLQVLRDKDKDYLLDIRHGRVSIENISKEVDSLFVKAQEAKEKSKLREHVDMDKISKMTRDILMFTLDLQYRY